MPAHLLLHVVDEVVAEGQTSPSERLLVPVGHLAVRQVPQLPQYLHNNVQNLMSEDRPR